MGYENHCVFIIHGLTFSGINITKRHWNILITALHDWMVLLCPKYNEKAHLITFTISLFSNRLNKKYRVFGAHLNKQKHLILRGTNLDKLSLKDMAPFW